MFVIRHSASVIGHPSSVYSSAILTQILLWNNSCNASVTNYCKTQLTIAMQEKGTISIHTENIFPIIKKFLYSDNEIFLRELVSNAVDATQKMKRLASLGQYSGE